MVGPLTRPRTDPGELVITHIFEFGSIIQSAGVPASLSGDIRAYLELRQSSCARGPNCRDDRFLVHIFRGKSEGADALLREPSIPTLIRFGIVHGSVDLDAQSIPGRIEVKDVRANCRLTPESNVFQGSQNLPSLPLGGRSVGVQVLRVARPVAPHP